MDGGLGLRGEARRLEPAPVAREGLAARVAKMTRAPTSVLLVDDEPDNLVALTAVLEPLDRELVQAGSGEEALKLLLAREFAVISSTSGCPASTASRRRR